MNFPSIPAAKSDILCVIAVVEDDIQILKLVDFRCHAEPKSLP